MKKTCIKGSSRKIDRTIKYWQSEQMTSSCAQIIDEADLLIQKTQFEKAITLLEGLLNDDSITSTEDRYADIIEKLINCYIQSKTKDDLVNRYFQHLLGIRKKSLGHDHEVTMNIKRKYGIFLAEQGNYNIALKNLRDFLDWFIQKYGESSSESDELIKPRFFIGKCYLQNRFLLEAQNCFQFCFRKRKSEVVDKRDSDYLTYSAELGNVLSLLDMHTQALSLLEEVYLISKEGEEFSSQHMLIMNYLALAYLRAGQEMKGNELFQHCIEKKKEKLGCFHVEIIAMYEQLIVISQIFKRCDETFDRFNTLYKLCLDHLGDSHFKTVQVLKDLHAFIETLPNKQRKVFLLAVHELQESILGKCSSATLETVKKLITLEIKMECLENLLELLNNWVQSYMEICSGLLISDRPKLRQIFHDIRLTIDTTICFLIAKDFNMFKTPCIITAESFVLSSREVITTSDTTGENPDLGNEVLLQENEEWLIQIFYRCREFKKLNDLYESKYYATIETFGAETIAACKALVALGDHHRHCEEFDAALEVYGRCQELYQRCSTGNEILSDKERQLHFEILVFLDVCYLSTTMNNKNIERFKTLYQSCKATFGERHVVTLNAMANYALADNDIIASFTDDLAKNIGFVDKESKARDLWRPYLVLGNILIQRREDKKALSILEPLLETWQKSFGDDLITLRANILLAQCYCNLGEMAKGTTFLQTSYEKSRLLRGDHHAETQRLKMTLKQNQKIGITTIVLSASIVIIILFLLIARFGSRYQERKVEL